MTRRSAEKKPATIPGVEYYTVGEGFTERKKWRMIPPGPENSFERRIVGVEAQAKRILEYAGLPTDLSSLYSIPGGEKVTLPALGAGTLMALVEARGFNERVDTEWYAAEFLIDLRNVRKFIAEGNTVEAAAFAADLGELVGEAKTKGYFAATGKAGGSQEKKIRPLQDWADQTVRQYPEKKEPIFWNSIPGDEPGDRPEQIAGAKMIRDGNKLKVTFPDGKFRTLARTSFKKYITRARESLKK